MRSASTSTPRNAAPFIVAASGWAPPIPPSPPVTTSRPASDPPKCWRGPSAKGFVVALRYPLRPDVDPRARRHLTVHREPERIEPSEFVPGRPPRHQVGIRDQHARRLVVGPEHPNRLPALHQQRLLIAQPAKGLHD